MDELFSIADDIQKKIEGLKMAKQLEEQEDNYEENIDETVASSAPTGLPVSVKVMAFDVPTTLGRR